jgi:hypothetical protein
MSILGEDLTGLFDINSLADSGTSDAKVQDDPQVERPAPLAVGLDPTENGFATIRRLHSQLLEASDRFKAAFIDAGDRERALKANVAPTPPPTFNNNEGETGGGGVAGAAAADGGAAGQPDGRGHFRQRPTAVRGADAGAEGRARDAALCRAAGDAQLAVGHGRAAAGAAGGDRTGGQD